MISKTIPRLKTVLNTCILLAALNSFAYSVAAEDSVSVSEIASTWQSTRIMEMTCEFDREYTSWQKRVVSDKGSPGNGFGPGAGGPGFDDFGVVIDENDPIKKTGRFVFRRHADFGMRMTDLDHDEDQNVFGDRGVSIRPGRFGQEGVNDVIIKKAGSASIQSSSRTAALLYWVDPLATKLCTRISRLSEGSLPIVQDPEYGPIVQLALREENGSSRVVLAKNYDWRIVSLTTAKSMERKHTFEYGRNLAGQLVLNRLTSITYHRDISDHPAFIETLTFTGHFFGCDPNDLRIDLPSNSLVRDSTGGRPNEYLIRHDGTIQNVTREELRLATPKELMNTEEGELFGKAAPNRTSFWIIVMGALLVGLAFVLILKRTR
jgi:hypothetical protein